VTEIRKESLSALIDGEASEIEIHKFVREFRHDDGITASWAIYQHIRATARADADQLMPGHHKTLFSRISVAIEAEQSHQKEPAQATSPKNVVIGSLALAASLVVAIFIGVGPPANEAPIAEVQKRSAVLNVQTVADQSEILPRTTELVELDEEKQRLLRAYLNQHDRMARMNSGRQFVNYKETPK